MLFLFPREVRLINRVIIEQRKSQVRERSMTYNKS